MSWLRGASAAAVGALVLGLVDIACLTTSDPDRAATRAVLRVFCDSFVHGAVGRWLAIWLRRLGMSEICCEPRVIPIGADFLRNGFQIEQAVRRACELGLIDGERGADFLRTLDDLAARKEFFCAATVFLVGATRP